METSRPSRFSEPRIHELMQQLQQSKLSRRGFIRSAVLLGLSVGAAEALAACAGPSGPTAIPTPTYSAPVSAPTNTPIVPSMEMEVQQHPSVPVVKEVPTYSPPATVVPPAPTATPVMWEGVAWSCPTCLQQFASQDDLVQHVLTGHTVKVPVPRRVDKPTYAQYLTDQLERFDQRNHVFSRTMWDTEYQQQLGAVTQRPSRATPAEIQAGAAMVAGAIYTDATAGSLVAGYGGYDGHLQGAKGLYSWDDDVNPLRYPVPDPAAMSEQIKAVARLYGADLVGICRLDQRWVYSHYFDMATAAYGQLEVPYQYAIVMGLEMDFAQIRTSPGFGASAATAVKYSRMAEVAPKLAKYIRMLGYPAVPCGNDTAQSIPLAIDAGLGELGRLGLLLTPEFGARQRLCKVLTDLPLVPDRPIDFGMQRFCEMCLACAHVCPAQAIPRGERSTERTSISNRPGIKRWHVNVGNCLLFWLSQGGVDCSNCIAACPWSFPLRPWL